jgi:carboxypeptidase D
MGRIRTPQFLKWSGQIVLAFGVMSGCSAPQTSTVSEQADDDGISYVRLDAAAIDKDFVKKFNFNRDHSSSPAFAFGYVPTQHVQALNQDFGATVLDASEWARFPHDPVTLERLEDHVKSHDVFEDYHDYEALTSELENLAAAHSDILSLHTAGQSVQGRELWYVKISDQVEVEENEPKLLYIANMHGDETVGREMMVYLVRKLVNDYRTDARVSTLVNNSQIYIMPSMNPDGFERGRRYNGRNSDLNRDFPDFTSDPSDTLNGRQVETQAVMQLHADHHFVFAINFHGGAICFNMPWDTKPNSVRSERFGDDSLMRFVARQYADAVPDMRNGRFEQGVTYGYEWYEVDGGMQDWASYYRRSFHATIELSNTKYPGASQLPHFWEQNEEALVTYLERGIMGVHLKVVDGAGNGISNVTTTVDSAWREVRSDHTYVYRPTMDGTQVVTISAPGFDSKTLTLDARSFDGTFTEVVLDAQ